MKKVRLGRTNLKVSRVGIGGIPLQRPSEKDAIEVIRHAIEFPAGLFNAFKDSFGNVHEIVQIK